MGAPRDQGDALMAFEWNPFALVGLAGAALSFTIAAVVYAARPRARQNRWLALSMVAEGIFVLGGWGLDPLSASASTAYASAMVTMVAWPFFPVLYLFFMSTLKAPLARPLASRSGQVVLVGLLLAAAAVAVFGRRLFVSGVIYDPKWYGYRWDWVFEPWFYAVLVLEGVVLLFGLAVAISLLRVTPRDSPRHPAAVAYLAAFAFRDSMLLMSMLFLLYAPSSLSSFTNLLPPLSVIGFTLLVGYGILRTQLFDIDLKIKWGLRRGTVVGIFVATIFIVSEAAQEFFGETTGSTYAGIAAAGLLVFAIAPLQRFADRIADAAMPTVRDDQEYRTVRKREVYQAALEGAIEDGVITERERTVLARLADSLGITAYEALALERDLTSATRASG